MRLADGGRFSLTAPRSEIGAAIVAHSGEIVLTNVYQTQGGPGRQPGLDHAAQRRGARCQRNSTNAVRTRAGSPARPISMAAR